MVCAHCGCENPEGIAYCRDCGMTLRAQGARMAMPTPTPEVSAASSGKAQPAAQAAAASSALPHGELPCPRCREANPTESRFCHACGFGLTPPIAQPPPSAIAIAPSVAARPIVPAAAPPQAAVVCARCRGVADPGADFCKFCGARLGAVDAQAAAPAEARSGSDAGAVLSPRALPTQAAAQPPSPQIDRSAAPVVAAPQGAIARPVAAQGAQGSAASASPPNRLMGATKPLHGIGDVAIRGTLVRIAKDGSEGVHHPVVNETTDVGRAEGNIILPDDPYLSPRHARILARAVPGGPAALFLIDLGSVNGTFVRLRSAHPLVHGDLLLLGQQVLRFEAVSELEGARGPAMQHGVLMFGSPAPVARARLAQRTVEGLTRDVVYLVRDEVIVGREMGDRTFPDDVFMSRRHAAVRREAGSYVLHDLGSSNGTFLQIHGEHPLLDGDQFRIGHHLFRVDLPAPSNGA